MTTAHEIPQWAKDRRPANVRATGSDAPEQYAPIPSTPAGSAYTVRGHAAQYRRGRRRAIRAIVLHTSESEDFAGSLTYDAWRPDTVSCHAFLGGSGEIGYDVPETSTAWTTSRWNDETLSVEIVGRAAWTAGQWRARPFQMIGLVVLLVDWCQRHMIPPIFLEAPAFAEGASRHGAPPVAGTNRGLTDHLAANRAAILLGGSPSSFTHSDVGPGLREVLFVDVLPEVVRRLAGAPPPYVPNPGGTMSDRYEFVGPARAVDTRREGRKLAAGETRTVQMPDPAGLLGVMVTITATEADAGGYITAWAGGPRPEVSCLNFRPGEDVANTHPVAVDGAGAFRIFTSSRTHLLVDVVGAYR